MEPWELQEARLVEALCERYSCLPRELMREDAHGIFQRLTLIAQADSPATGGGSGPALDPRLRDLDEMSMALAEDVTAGLTSTADGADFTE